MEQLKRDTTLDIAKAVCIILMVIGHAGCPKYMCDVVYLFHMPCFFFISGLLFNEKYYANLSSGIKKKLRSYYVPFVKWELILLLFHIYMVLSILLRPLYFLLNTEYFLLVLYHK